MSKVPMLLDILKKIINVETCIDIYEFLLKKEGA